MKYTVSILAYGKLELTRKCVESVLKHSDDIEIILTDNASTDGTGAYMDSVRPAPNQSVRVVHNPTNEGFIEPNRRALASASGEFFVMLNNDTTVPPAWLTVLAEPFARFPKAALSGPAGNCCQILPNFHGTGGNNFEYLEGSCLMGRTELLRKHGLFDPNLNFAYGEDSDLSLRMRELGYTLHRVNLVVPHARGSTSKTVPGIAAIEEKNLSYLRQKWAIYLKTRRLNYPVIVKRRAAFGDVLLITPIIRALKNKHPASPIWVQTHCGEILKGNPLIDRIEQKFMPLPPDALVVDLDMAYENALHTHYIDAYAAKAGVKAERRCELYPTKDDALWAERVIPGRPWVAIHTGPTSWASRNWTNDRWQKVISELEMNVVVVGHDTHQFKPPANHLIVHARGSLMQTAAVLARASIFIGVDSLPIHMAQAMGTPVIGLFGVTLPEFVLADGPWLACRAAKNSPAYGLRHKVIGKNIVDDPHHCMLTITPEQVIETFKHHARNSPSLALS